MRKRDLERLKKKLLAEKERIVSNAADTKKDISNPNVDDLQDEVDIASSEITQTVHLRLRDREKMLLDKIEQSLKRIDEGTYGVCETCGEDISLKRLDARPVATLCIRCKEEQEKMEKEYS